MRRNFASSILCRVFGLGLLTLLQGCPKVAVDTNVHTDLPEAVDKMKESLDHLDPIGTKQLLQQNEDLRKKVQELSAKLTGLSEGLGVITIKGRRLQVQVEHYQGAFRVTGFVDSETNWFWQDRVFPNAEQALSVDPTTVIYQSFPLVESVEKTPGFATGNPNWGLTLAVVIKGAKNEAQLLNTAYNEAFKSFLKNTPLQPRPENSSIDLDQQLGGYGQHLIHLAVTPIEKTASGKWAFRGRIVSLPPDGQPFVIKQFDLDSDKFSQQPLNQALPIVKAILQVQSGT